MEEQYWHSKSKIKWSLEGDRNTTYFHRISKIKKNFRPISLLMPGDTPITDPSEISNHTIKYFENLFSANLSFVQNFSMVDHTIPPLVDATNNRILTNIPSIEEISAAVFSLNEDSAPGPDGFGAAFFQTYWDIIKEDVSNAVVDLRFLFRAIPLICRDT